METGTRKRKSRFSAESRNGQTEMDPRIWSLLPADLLLRMTSFLPLVSVLRLRSASKDLNCILRSATFIQQHAERTKLYPPWVLFHVFKACAGGLLLFRTREGWYVCNPLARTWRKLPRPQSIYIRGPVAGLIVEPGSFKVIVAEGGQPWSEEYDSKLNSWQWRGEGTIYNFLFPPVSCRGHLYTGQEDTSAGSLELVYYSLQTGYWREVAKSATVTKSMHISSANWVESGKRMYFVGVVRHEDGSVESIRIWSFDESTEKFREIARAPAVLISVFTIMTVTSSNPVCGIDAFGEGNAIVLSGHGSSAMALYDVSNGSWKMVFLGKKFDYEDYWTPSPNNRTSSYLVRSSFVPTLFHSSTVA